MNKQSAFPGLLSQPPTLSGKKEKGTYPIKQSIAVVFRVITILLLPLVIAVVVRVIITQLLYVFIVAIK